MTLVFMENQNQQLYNNDTESAAIEFYNAQNTCTWPNEIWLKSNIPSSFQNMYILLKQIFLKIFLNLGGIFVVLPTLDAYTHTCAYISGSDKVPVSNIKDLVSFLLSLSRSKIISFTLCNTLVQISTTETLTITP